ncbi:hypothetical protein ADUPG1_010891 [Aduncisulcus paluster]|uniref:Uncharacterized protein n=1 Tax=Aduncisulcus paluster TaxID=2918883 RepID=A0ABQ5JTR6_9EUKA|nr:hypothetical protein ADUPG1_010891 [Aduncisulcus paluster]
MLDELYEYFITRTVNISAVTGAGMDELLEMLEKAKEEYTELEKEKIKERGAVEMDKFEADKAKEEGKKEEEDDREDDIVGGQSISHILGKGEKEEEDRKECHCECPCPCSHSCSCSHIHEKKEVVEEKEKDILGDGSDISFAPPPKRDQE